MSIDGHSHEPDPGKRVTAPMYEFKRREVGIGAAVTLVGLFVAYVIRFGSASEQRISRPDLNHGTPHQSGRFTFWNTYGLTGPKLMYT